MGKITIVEAPEITLWYHTDAKVVHHQFHRYPGVAVLEATLEKGLEVLRDHAAHKWLSDDRKGGAIPKAHHEWAATMWGPRAVAAGWKYWALVPPKEALGLLNMSRLKETYGALGVTVNVVADPRAAMTWLMQCRDG